MICEPCKAAGKALQDGQMHIARYHHKRCEHPATCSCQHKLGEDE